MLTIITILAWLINKLNGSLYKWWIEILVMHKIIFKLLFRAMTSLIHIWSTFCHWCEYTVLWRWTCLQPFVRDVQDYSTQLDACWFQYASQSISSTFLFTSPENVTSGEKHGQRSCPCFWFMQNLNRILCDIYQKHVTNYVHYWTWVLCQASIENARLSWEVLFNIVMWFKKTKQDVLRENRVYYCIEKECLLRKFKTKLPGKLLTMKEI